MSFIVQEQLDRAFALPKRMFEIMYSGVQSLKNPTLGKLKSFLQIKKPTAEEFENRIALQDTNQSRSLLRKNMVTTLEHVCTVDASKKKMFAEVLVCSIELNHILMEHVCEAPYDCDLKELKSDLTKLLAYCPIDDPFLWLARYQILKPRINQLKDAICHKEQLLDDRLEERCAKKKHGNDDDDDDDDDDGDENNNNNNNGKTTGLEDDTDDEEMQRLTRFP